MEKNKIKLFTFCFQFIWSFFFFFLLSSFVVVILSFHHSTQPERNKFQGYMLACIIRYCGIMVGNICVVSAVFQTMELYMEYKN